MAGSWGILIRELGQAERNSSTIDAGAQLNRAMNSSCLKTHSIFDNPKGADTKKDDINSVEKPPSFFNSLFVFRAETKEELIPAKKAYHFFDKQAGASDKQKETYTEKDVMDPDELIPLFSKQNLVPRNKR